MKVLNPHITCLLTIHMKSTAFESLQSLIQQTCKDFEVIVIDSGKWIGKDNDVSKKMEEIYNAFAFHPLIDWYITGELDNEYKNTCMISKVTNAAINAGLIRGKYFCTFYDDDVYYPDFMKKMSEYLDNHDSAGVMCHQKRTVIKNGISYDSSPLKQVARIGEDFCCNVDGMQIMLRTEILDKIPYPWLPENLEDCHHSDGVFMNKIGKISGTIPVINEFLCEHRFTDKSVFHPS